MRSLFGVTAEPPVMTVVFPCSGGRRLSFSVDAGACSLLAFRTLESCVSGIEFTPEELSALGVTSLAALVGDDTSELDCANLEPEDVTRDRGVKLPPGDKLPEVGDAVSASLNRLDEMPGDFFDGTVLLLWTPPLEVVVVSGLPGAGEPGLG